ncbi:MAG TPA: YfiR family protein, partial [Rhizomicrobium sp.]
DSTEGCQIFYFRREDPGGVQMAQNLQNRPVLTVTNGVGAPAPAIIAFVVENGHVRFDIDDAAAARAGLAVSSNLLALARSVRRAP